MDTFIIMLFLSPSAQLKECPSLRVLSAPLSEARDRYRGVQAPHPPVPQHYDTLRVS